MGFELDAALAAASASARATDFEVDDLIEGRRIRVGGGGIVVVEFWVVDVLGAPLDDVEFELSSLSSFSFSFSLLFSFRELGLGGGL